MKRFLLFPVAILLVLMALSPAGLAFAASVPQSHVQTHPMHLASFQPAVSCFQNGCTGQDPIATGCSSSASTVLSGGIFNASGTRIGTINLRFSSVCQTNWAQVVSLIGSVPLAAIVTRASGADGPRVSECEPNDCNSFITSTSAFTNMVWAPDVAALAGGEMHVNGSNFFGCVTQNQGELPCN